MLKNNDRRKNIIYAYLAAVVVYGCIAALFTATVHVVADEEIYLTLAKSFHYSGRFEINGNLADYNCVLYSMLISLAYFVYQPETILLVMRIMGVLAMCSAVFPIYAIAQKILQDEKKAFLISVITLLMPYMFDTAYIMQEVLSYPLFLWTVYIWYCATEKGNEQNIGKYILCAFFSALCFFTKTYLFFIPVIINLMCVPELVDKSRRMSTCKKLMVYDITYTICVVLAYASVFALNGFVKGSNHYSTQFSAIFPITGWTVASAAVGIVVYSALFLLNTAVLPIPAIVYYRKKFAESERKLVDFTLLSIAVLIAEIVVLIVLTEEGVPTVPHKFLFRYFQILVPPVLILFAKIWKEEAFLQSKKVHAVTLTAFFVALVYFCGMQGKTRQSIIDGHLYLLLENISKYILPYADVFSVVVVCGVLLWGYYMAIQKKKAIMPLFRKLCLLGIVCFWILNCFQLPFFTNRIAGGTQIQQDSLQIADYLNDNGYKEVFFVVDDGIKKNDYIRNFYGYIRQPYCIVDAENELEEVMKDKDLSDIAFLVRDGYKPEGQFEKVEIETDKLDLYIYR